MIGMDVIYLVCVCFKIEEIKRMDNILCLLSYLDIGLAPVRHQDIEHLLKS